MATLTGVTIAGSYQQLLQIGSSNAGLSASIQYVQDGSGVNSVLGLSTTAVQINATSITINGVALTVAGTASISGTNTGDQTITLTGDVTGSGTGSFATTVSKINGATLGTTTATSGNLLIGSGTQWVSNPVSGNVTISSSGVTTIGATQVTNAMLAGSIAASKLIGTDIATVGTITSGTWTGTTIAVANGGTGVTTSTGTGNVVLSTSPTFVTPLLGTPTSGTLTNCTGYTEANISFTDITTNNSSTSKHGFLKKLDNVSTHYMDGTGNWSSPAGSGTVTSVSVVTANNFSGTVANSTTTPAITIGANTTTFTGLSSTVSNVTGDGTTYTLLINTNVTDTGSNYNQGTGIYTCPVTGFYMISGFLLMNGLTSSHTECIVQMAGTQTADLVVCSPYAYGATSVIAGNAGVSFNALVSRTANDTISINITVSSGTKVVGLNSTSTGYGIALIR